MAKKLTYEFVKESFEKEGYTLLSKDYKNAHTKLDYICPEDHIHKISWTKWLYGVRCPYCSGNIKKTIDEVRKFFGEEGYTLLSKEYINNYTKLKFICPNGHKHAITWSSWRQGARCRYCVDTNIKLTIEFVRERFEKERYILTSSEYKSNKVKLNYICPNGHSGSISWNNWAKGERCYTCNGSIPLKYKDVKASFELENYVLLSTKYVNASSKLNYMCDKKHYGSITWKNWSQGYRCPTCAIINNSGSRHYNWKGGISFEPYCEVWKDQEYKKDIRNRDGNKCLNPYCDSPDNTDLTIHHIDYNKKNCKPSNLITVCRSCNSKANTDRNWHKAWYKAILNKRYKYNY